MLTSSDSEKTNSDPSLIEPAAKTSFYAEENRSAPEDDDIDSSEDTVIVSETSSELIRGLSENSLPSKNNDATSHTPKPGSPEGKANVDMETDISTSNIIYEKPMTDMVEASEITEQQKSPIPKDNQKIDHSDLNMSNINAETVVNPKSENLKSPTTGEDFDIVENKSDIKKSPVDVEQSSPPNSTSKTSKKHSESCHCHMDIANPSENTEKDSASPISESQNSSKCCNCDMNRMQLSIKTVYHLNSSKSTIARKDVETYLSDEEIGQPLKDDETFCKDLKLEKQHNRNDSASPEPPEVNIEQDMFDIPDEKIKNLVVISSSDDESNIIEVSSSDDDDDDYDDDDDDDEEEVMVKADKICKYGNSSRRTSKINSEESYDQYLDHIHPNCNTTEDVSYNISLTRDFLSYDSPYFTDHMSIANSMMLSMNDEKESVCTKFSNSSVNVSQHKSRTIGEQNNLSSDGDSRKLSKQKVFPSDNGNHIRHLRDKMMKGCGPQNPIDLDVDDDNMSSSEVPSTHADNVADKKISGKLDDISTHVTNESPDINDDLVIHVETESPDINEDLSTHVPVESPGINEDSSTRVATESPGINQDLSRRVATESPGINEDSSTHVATESPAINQDLPRRVPSDSHDINEDSSTHVATESPDINEDLSTHVATESLNTRDEICIETMEHKSPDSKNGFCTRDDEKKRVQCSESVDEENSEDTSNYQNIDVLIDLMNKDNDMVSVSSQQPVETIPCAEDNTQDEIIPIHRDVGHGDHKDESFNKQNTQLIYKEKSTYSNMMEITSPETNILNSADKETSQALKSNAEIQSSDTYAIESCTLSIEQQDDHTLRKKRKRKRKSDSHSMVACVNTFNQLLSAEKNITEIEVTNENLGISEKNVDDVTSFKHSTNYESNESVKSIDTTISKETDGNSCSDSFKKQRISCQDSDNISDVNVLGTDSGDTADGSKRNTDEDIDMNTLSSSVTSEYTSLSHPQQVGASYREFQSGPENYLRGCLWSPDGSCILTNSDDNILRLFKIPDNLLDEAMTDDLSAELKMCEGEMVYDMDWYPFMDLQSPDTCCFLSTSRDHPIHLWDSYTGALRCTYRAFDQMDELASAHCVAFNVDGSKIYCGFDKCIRIFDSSRPGNECTEICTRAKKNQSRKGKSKHMQSQPGIISSIAFSGYSGLFALGSFSKTVGLYDANDGKAGCIMNGHTGGVTQVKFTSDGYYLLSGARKDSELIWWDLRNTSLPLFKLIRHVATNQRIQFDINRDNTTVFSGSTDNMVNIWDLKQLPNEIEDDVVSYEPTHQFCAHDDAVNAVCLHPVKPLLATTSGQRHFFEDSDSESTGMEKTFSKFDNSLKIWKI